LRFFVIARFIKERQDETQAKKKTNVRKIKTKEKKRGTEQTTSFRNSLRKSGKLKKRKAGREQLASAKHSSSTIKRFD